MRTGLSMKALLDGFRTLGPMRLAAMGAVALGILTVLGYLAAQGGGHGKMALLYGDLDLREAAQMADQLDKAHIPHELGTGDDRLMVPADQVAAARLLLAKSGLPSGGSVGYEIFDRGDALTATQFEQSINQTRALEGELTRSIRLIRGVRAARVHLVLPHREPFETEETAAQASVLLSMSGANRLDGEGVQAVINLVAAAVPGLKPQNIAVVDDRGDVLSRAGAPTGTMGAAQSVEELRQATELRLAHAVEEMLEPSLGSEHVRAEAAVAMDVDQVKETQESYDPNGQVLRSQQTVSDKNHSTDAVTNTTVGNNLPNANAGQVPSGSQGDRQEETSNYEIGKTVRTLVRDEPRLSRISLAVMVDGETVPDPAGKPVWKPRPAEELDRISTLVKSAIGYDAKRGDTVSVVSMPFTTGRIPAEEGAPKGLLGTAIDGATAAHLGQNLILGVLLLLGLLFVVRPMIGRRDESAALAPPAEAVVPQLAGGGAGEKMALPTPAAGGTALVPADEGALVTIARIDGRMRAASIKQVMDLVGQHPEESLTVVRDWLSREAGA